MDEVVLTIEETDGIPRTAEPVSVGVPFPPGGVMAVSSLGVKGPDNRWVPCQITPTACWHDGSLRWALVRFQASVEPCTQVSYLLSEREDASIDTVLTMDITESGSSIRVDTGRCVFHVDKEVFQPFSRVSSEEPLGGDSASWQTRLEDCQGHVFTPTIEKVSVETKGRLESVLLFEGTFRCDEQQHASFIARLTFFAGKATVKQAFTLWNPEASAHPDGFWDLGAEGSLFLSELYQGVRLSGSDGKVVVRDARGAMDEIKGTDLRIVQSSSGGENWQSTVHAHPDPGISPEFFGYKVWRDGREVGRGSRVTPVMSYADSGQRVSVTLGAFWQNFPKSMAFEDSALGVSLFPKSRVPHELQGGERKTHTIFWDFSSDGDGLTAVHAPLVPKLSADWYAHAHATGYLAGQFPDPGAECRAYIASFMNPGKFLADRERIDEYGWRHYGEVYADHEAVNSDPEEPLISHYNNQYDPVAGFARQYMETGSKEWYRLFTELADHVKDIDIYHTKKDRDEYNGGMFWHTNHYLDADLSTHRSHAVRHREAPHATFCGGGPGLGHCYSHGLLLTYWMTGDALAREALLTLTGWVEAQVTGPNSMLGTLNDVRKRLKNGKNVFRGARALDVRYPFTRGTGNAVSTLLDAHALTQDRHYLSLSETVIKGTFSPCDDIGCRNLGDIENTWSYTVFLQAVARYLHLKEQMQEQDAAYGHAKQSFLHYARWMARNETLVLDNAHRLEYPNETWPAQDLRKSCVLYLAAIRAPAPEAKLFRSKAADLCEGALGQLKGFPTWHLARPQTLVLQNIWVARAVLGETDAPPTVDAAVVPEQQGGNYLTKTRLLFYGVSDLLQAMRRFSIQREARWLRSRM